jgi:hypothetical protein
MKERSAGPALRIYTGRGGPQVKFALRDYVAEINLNEVLTSLLPPLLIINHSLCEPAFTGWGQSVLACSCSRITLMRS